MKTRSQQHYNVVILNMSVIGKNLISLYCKQNKVQKLKTTSFQGLRIFFSYDPATGEVWAQIPDSGHQEVNISFVTLIHSTVKNIIIESTVNLGLVIII